MKRTMLALAAVLSISAAALAADESPRICGGLAGFQCGENEYCNFPASAQCGAADQTGTCAPRPQICSRIWMPVCGCDGKTYGNECEAAGAGVSVVHEGEC